MIVLLKVTAGIHSVWCFIIIKIRTVLIYGIRSPVVMLQRKSFKIPFEQIITHQSIVFYRPVRDRYASKIPVETPAASLPE
jgi:hypothetical protein